MGNINYRAIHTKSLWRKVNTHQTLESAINGKDGAAGLFARKVRINYATHGDPLYVIAWESGASSGYIIKGDSSAPSGIRKTSVPIATIMEFENRGQASPSELERLF
jgi:5-methylcytosine-specific restriction protein A